MSSSQPLILFDPFGIENEYNDRTFTKFPGDLHWTLKKHFNSLGYEVHTTDYGNIERATWIVFFGHPGTNRFFNKCIEKGKKKNLLLFLFEPPVVDPSAYLRQEHSKFNKVFTYITTLPDQKKYYQYYFPQPDFPLRTPTPLPFGEKKFLVLMNGNKDANPKFFEAQKQSTNDLFQSVVELYSERRRFIKFAETNLPTEFDLYGHGWSKANHGWKNIFRRGYTSYRGVAQNKISTLQHYKYVICYENAAGLDGYITEKIFDCFRAATVPIYWGAADIDAYIPSECYIDRRIYRSNHDLIMHLRSITPAQYSKYIAAGAEFLCSKEIRKWTNQSFSENLARVLTSSTA